MGLLDNTAVVAYAVPLIFLFVSGIIAVPPLIFDFVIHPITYVTAEDPAHHVRQRFFYFLWRIMGPMIDSSDKVQKQPLLEKCYGVVLEVGAGVGDNVKYYQKDKVKRLILVEPNTSMHDKLRAKANAAGFDESDGSLLLLGCGAAAEDEKVLEKAGVTAGSVDTISLIHVLCGIPKPTEAIEFCRKLLKPGGLVIFYEHVRSDDKTTADWQSWYTRMLWKPIFNECELDRPTGDWLVRGPRGDFGAGQTGVHLDRILAKGESGSITKRWKEYKIEVPPEQHKYSLMAHVKGWAIMA